MELVITPSPLMTVGTEHTPLQRTFALNIKRKSGKFVGGVCQDIDLRNTRGGEGAMTKSSERCCALSLSHLSPPQRIFRSPPDSCGREFIYPFLKIASQCQNSDSRLGTKRYLVSILSLPPIFQGHSWVGRYILAPHLTQQHPL